MMPQLLMLVGVSQENPSVPTEGELVRGVRDMLLTRKIPVSFVFALQMFVDIHHVLDMEIPRLFWDYTDAGKKWITALQKFLEYSAAYPARTLPSYYNRDAKRLVKSIKRCTGTDMLIDCREREANGSDRHWAKIPCQLFINHIIIWDLYLLNATLCMQKVGLMLFRVTGLVQAAAISTTQCGRRKGLTYPGPT